MEGSNKRVHRTIPALALLCAILAIPACRVYADIPPNRVLVVYNSTATGATALKDAYLAAHPDIPAANVFNINRPELAAAATITFSQFDVWIRDPIRAYLLQAGPPAPQDIVAIVLIRPFPHRIGDLDNFVVGDTPGAAANETNAGDATFAAVDADLVLLWQNLDAGEAGGRMDSKADNFIDNPYHQSNSAIDGFSRANIQASKAFAPDLIEGISWTLSGSGASQLTPGDLYLVCRIDGPSLADAQALIQRSQNLYINKAATRILFDEFDVGAGNDADDDGLYVDGPVDLYWAGDDYEETRNALAAAGWTVRYDGSNDFISCAEETAWLVGLSSYGENHSSNGAGEDPAGDGIYASCYRYAPGAMFNTLESFNGRDLNGVGQHPLVPQGQISDFVAAGGSFGIGHVWEPFSFSLPDSEFMMVNFLSGDFTWAEAAYTSIPALSWQQMVVGDPLSKPAIINDPGLPKGDMNGDGVVNAMDMAWFTDVMLNGIARYRATLPALDPLWRGDFDGDYRVTFADLSGFVAALLP